MISTVDSLKSVISKATDQYIVKRLDRMNIEIDKEGKSKYREEPESNLDAIRKKI